MSNKFEAKIDVKTLEFLLDLPTEFSLYDVKMIDNVVILSMDTELTVPSEVTLQYQTDEYGNTALVGLNE